MDAPKLSHWLHRRNSVLVTVLSRSERLARANHDLREWLQEPWADSVRFANLDGTQAVIHAAHAAAATQLRFRGPDLLVWIRQRYNPACLEISVKVRPSA